VSADSAYYHILFEDGDEEDVSDDEFQAMLLPDDTGDAKDCPSQKTRLGVQAAKKGANDGGKHRSSSASPRPASLLSSSSSSLPHPHRLLDASFPGHYQRHEWPKLLGRAPKKHHGPWR